MAMTSMIGSPYVRELPLDEVVDDGKGPRFVVETMIPEILERNPHASNALALADTREEAEAFIEALDPSGLIPRWGEAMKKRRSA